MTPSSTHHLLSIAHSVSAVVPERSAQQVFLYLLSEAGELAEEILIHNGDVSKPAGKDGVVGEVCDVINCLADLIWVGTQGSPEARDNLCARIVEQTNPFAFEQSLSFDQAMSAFSHEVSDLRGLYVLTHAGQNVGCNDPALEVAANQCARLIDILLMLARAADPGLEQDAFLERYRQKCAKWRAQHIPE